jgi:hypothetical protein
MFSSSRSLAAADLEQTVHDALAQYVARSDAEIFRDAA